MAARAGRPPRGACRREAVADAVHGPDVPRRCRVVPEPPRRAISETTDAGIDGRTSSRELVDHNLTGTINVLEYCKAHKAGFILLSTSRVYSIAPLAARCSML